MGTYLGSSREETCSLLSCSGAQVCHLLWKRWQGSVPSVPAWVWFPAAAACSSWWAPGGPGHTTWALLLALAVAVGFAPGALGWREATERSTDAFWRRWGGLCDVCPRSAAASSALRLRLTDLACPPLWATFSRRSQLLSSVWLPAWLWGTGAQGRMELAAASPAR